MAGQGADRLCGIEHQIHVADINRGAIGAEDRVRDRIAHAAVVEEQPEGRVEVVEQGCHVEQLPAALSLGKAVPDAKTAREDLQRMARHADFHVGLGPPVVVDAVLSFAGLRLAALVGNARLVFDQRLGAEQVRNARRHITDLGADRLGMPFGEQRAVEAVRRLLDFQAFTDLASDAFVLAQAQQPRPTFPAPMIASDEPTSGRSVLRIAPAPV